MFMCRWLNGDVSFVSARTKGDAIIKLDEWDDAEGAEIIQIRDFMADFRLTDEGNSGVGRIRRKLPRHYSQEGVPSFARGHHSRCNHSIRRHYP